MDQILCWDTCFMIFFSFLNMIYLLLVRVSTNEFFLTDDPRYLFLFVLFGSVFYFTLNLKFWGFYKFPCSNIGPLDPLRFYWFDNWTDPFSANVCILARVSLLSCLFFPFNLGEFYEAVFILFLYIIKWNVNQT